MLLFVCLGKNCFLTCIWNVSKTVYEAAGFSDCRKPLCLTGITWNGHLQRIIGNWLPLSSSVFCEYCLHFLFYEKVKNKRCSVIHKELKSHRWIKLGCRNLKFHSKKTLKLFVGYVAHGEVKSFWVVRLQTSAANNKLLWSTSFSFCVF